MLSKTKIGTGTVRQRVNARVTAMTSGRWETARPLLKLDTEQLLERAFDRAVILSRETVEGLTWNSALSVLRVWEYTGRVRRGYFIEGLSGRSVHQGKGLRENHAFARASGRQDYLAAAVDPGQVWGKSLAHKMKGRLSACRARRSHYFPASPLLCLNGREGCFACSTKAR
jgi:ATP-dependent Lhr-like helicase